MIEQRLHIEVNDGKPELVLDPRVGANFRQVRVAVPGIENFGDELRFCEDVDAACRAACGLGSNLCGSRTVPKTEPLPDSRTTIRRVVDGVLSCARVDCPLIIPPSADDSELLTPSPAPPSLEAHAEA